MRWAVIEMAGMERGEKVRRGDFASLQAADTWARQHYPGDEREELHVDIAFWDGAGWSYDY